MSTAALITHQARYRLVLISGPEKGTTYQLLSPQISIGRSEENDIILKDPRCSRKHAVLEITDEGVEVTDVSQKNAITFNKQKRDKALLTHGAVFTIGSTEIRLEMSAPQSVPQTIPSSDMISEATSIAFAPAKSPPQRPRTARAPRKNMTFYYIVIGLVLLGLWLFWPTKKKVKDDVPIQTDESVDSTIQDFRSKQQMLKKQMNTSPQYKEAQSLYLQGFRDYRKGQYGRAIEEFRAALSIYPDHALATRYLKMARKQLDETVQMSMIEGRQYRERNMFKRCVASFDIAMTLLGDPNNRIFKEAKEIRDECALHLGEE